MEKLSKAEMLELSLIENLPREDLNPMDEAKGYKRLLEECGLSQKKLSERISKDRSSIANTLRLLNLPKSVQSFIANGELSEGHARAILSLDDEFSMLQIAERIIKEELSVRNAEALVKKSGRRQKILFGVEKEPNLASLEDEMTKLLRARITIKWKKNKGMITIQCLGLDDFTRIYEIIKRGSSRA